MWVKMYFLFFITFACFIGPQLARQVNVPTVVDGFYIPKISKPFIFAADHCYFRGLVPVTLNDLKEATLLWEAITEAEGTLHNPMPHQFWAIERDFSPLEIKAISREIAEQLWSLESIEIPLRCFRFSRTRLGGFHWSPADCTTGKLGVICKLPGLAEFRSLVGSLKERLESGVSKTKEFGRWMKSKLKRMHEFTGEELSDVLAVVKDTLHQSGSKIGSKMGDFTQWTKDHAKTLAHKIGESLKWSKDKVKDVLHKAFGVIDEETDEILKE